MNIEKQDNWRGKLLDLDNLPDDTAFDKHAAWHRLQRRLQPAARRKKAYWYWAAATLVVLLGWPLLIKKTTAPPPSTNTARRQVNKAVAPIPSVTKEAPGFIIASGPVVKKTAVQKPFRQTTQTVNTMEDTILSVLVDVQQSSAAASAPPQADSAALTAATAKPEKKLSVVHINDLETAATQLALSPASVHSRWRIKHPTRTHANQLLAAQKGYDGIINIKLSSKN